MEEVHPIPQNVTSFQFKLIGDMTLKQFMYLGAGAAISYLLFVFLAHDYPVISWPLIVISALSGVSFAFLPIESRPLDHWLSAFLRAIYSPTKRAWKQNGKTFKENPAFVNRLSVFLAGAAQSSNTLNASATSEMPNVLPAGPLPTPEELGKTVDLARQAQQLKMKIIQNERTLSQIKSEAQKPAPIPVDYSQQVNKVLADLQGLVDRAAAIKQQIRTVQEPEPQIVIPGQTVREKIRVVIPPKPQQTQLALTTFPNVINGVVKDKENNYLEGVVAVIYDKEGLPVRALKTNKLGQFTGSTPLPNGIYTLELEKENFSFDVLQLELGGDVLPPLLITAK